MHIICCFSWVTKGDKLVMGSYGAWCLVSYIRQQTPILRCDPGFRPGSDYGLQDWLEDRYRHGSRARASMSISLASITHGKPEGYDLCYRKITSEWSVTKHLTIGESEELDRAILVRTAMLVHAGALLAAASREGGVPSALIKRLTDDVYKLNEHLHTNCSMILSNWWHTWIGDWATACHRIREGASSVRSARQLVKKKTRLLERKTLITLNTWFLVRAWGCYDGDPNEFMRCRGLGECSYGDLLDDALECTWPGAPYGWNRSLDQLKLIRVDRTIGLKGPEARKVVSGSAARPGVEPKHGRPGASRRLVGYELLGHPPVSGSSPMAGGSKCLQQGKDNRTTRDDSDSDTITRSETKRDAPHSRGLSKTSLTWNGTMSRVADWLVDDRGRFERWVAGAASDTPDEIMIKRLLNHLAISYDRSVMLTKIVIDDPLVPKETLDRLSIKRDVKYLKKLLFEFSDSFVTECDTLTLDVAYHHHVIAELRDLAHSLGINVMHPRRRWVLEMYTAVKSAEYDRLYVMMMDDRDALVETLVSMKEAGGGRRQLSANFDRINDEYSRYLRRKPRAYVAGVGLIDIKLGLDAGQSFEAFKNATSMGILKGQRSALYLFWLIQDRSAFDADLADLSDAEPRDRSLKRYLMHTARTLDEQPSFVWCLSNSPAIHAETLKNYLIARDHAYMNHLLEHDQCRFYEVLESFDTDVAYQASLRHKFIPLAESHDLAQTPLKWHWSMPSVRARLEMRDRQYLHKLLRQNRCNFNRALAGLDEGFDHHVRLKEMFTRIASEHDALLGSPPLRWHATRKDDQALMVAKDRVYLSNLVKGNRPKFEEELAFLERSPLPREHRDQLRREFSDKAFELDMLQPVLHWRESNARSQPALEERDREHLRRLLRGDRNLFAKVFDGLSDSAYHSSLKATMMPEIERYALSLPPLSWRVCFASIKERVEARDKAYLEGLLLSDRPAYTAALAKLDKRFKYHRLLKSHCIDLAKRHDRSQPPLGWRLCEPSIEAEMIAKDKHYLQELLTSDRKKFESVLAGLDLSFAHHKRLKRAFVKAALELDLKQPELHWAHFGVTTRKALMKRDREYLNRLLREDRLTFERALSGLNTANAYHQTLKREFDALADEHDLAQAPLAWRICRDSVRARLETRDRDYLTRLLASDRGVFDRAMRRLDLSVSHHALLHHEMINAAKAKDLETFGEPLHWKSPSNEEDKLRLEARDREYLDQLLCKDRVAFYAALEGLNTSYLWGNPHHKALKSEYIEKAERFDIESVQVAPFFKAVSDNNIAEVRRLIISNPAWLKTALRWQDSRGRTVLCIAAEQGFLDVLALLVEQEVDVNHQTFDGNTALMLAIVGGHVRVVIMLLRQAGIALNLLTNAGRTAIFAAVYNNQEEIIRALVRSGAKDITGEALKLAKKRKQRTIMGYLNGVPSGGGGASRMPVGASRIVRTGAEGGEDMPEAKEVSPGVYVGPLRSDGGFGLSSSKVRDSLTIPYRELKLGTKIAEGGFGAVYKAKWSGSEVAVKMLRVATFSPAALEELTREAAVMAGLRHPNVVNFYGICTERSHECLIMEYMAGGSLYGVLKAKETSLDWGYRYRVSKESAHGLAYLHSRPIPMVHRDLKSLNVLLDEYQHAKLSDFGLAKARTAEDSSAAGGIVGTYRWCAPEVIKEEQNDEKSDIYSFGMLLWEIASRKVPFSGRDIGQAGLVLLISRGETETVPEGTPEKYADLIRSCWQERSRRPTAQAVADALDALYDSEGAPPDTSGDDGLYTSRGPIYLHRSERPAADDSFETDGKPWYSYRSGAGK